MTALPRFSVRALRALSLAFACVAAGSAFAADAPVTVQEPWVRATVTGQVASGAFMTLTAPAATRLVAARSPRAANVEIHEVSMQNDVMRMRAISGIDLPAGTPVVLRPGSYHIMLFGLKEPLEPGQQIPLTLTFRGADNQSTDLLVTAGVRALGAAASGTMPQDMKPQGMDHGGMKHEGMKHEGMNHGDMKHEGMDSDRPAPAKPRPANG